MAQLGDAADDLVKEAKEINGIKTIITRFDGMSVDELRGLSDDIKKENQNTAMVFAAVNEDKAVFMVSLTDDLVEGGLHAGNMVKEIAKVAGGGGGGKANMAQAGAKDISKIDEAFRVAESLIK